MTKKQVVWLIIKLIGIYFVYSAFVALFTLFSSIYAYTSLPSPPRFSKAETQNSNMNPPITVPGFPSNPTINNPSASPKTETETPAEKAKNDALKLLLWNLLVTALYGAAGWYLIRDGRFLFAILNREDPFTASGETADDNSPSPSRKKEAVVTSLNLSGGKEEITSLNLSDSSNIQTEPAVIPPAMPENIPDETPVKEEITSPNLSDSTIGETEQPTVFPAETKENELLEIPEDESIDEQKY